MPLLIMTNAHCRTFCTKECLGFFCFCLVHFRSLNNWKFHIKLNSTTIRLLKLSLYLLYSDSLTNKQTNKQTSQQTNKHKNKQTSKQTRKHDEIIVRFSTLQFNRKILFQISMSVRVLGCWAINFFVTVWVCLMCLYVTVSCLLTFSIEVRGMGVCE